LSARPALVGLPAASLAAGRPKEAKTFFKGEKQKYLQPKVASLNISLIV
jgi:hypothetical protein